MGVGSVWCMENQNTHGEGEGLSTQQPTPFSLLPSLTAIITRLILWHHWAPNSQGERVERWEVGQGGGMEEEEEEEEEEDEEGWRDREIENNNR